MPSLAETPRNRKARGHAEPPALVDVAYVARWLKKPEKMIYRLANEGRLPGVVRVGRSVRFDRAKLEAWVRDGGGR